MIEGSKAYSRRGNVMEADIFILLNLDSAIRLAQMHGIIEVLPSFDADSALQIRPTERGRLVIAKLRPQLSNWG